MEKQKKLEEIKKYAPVLYSLGILGLCFYVFFRARQFLNLVTGMETGYVVFGVFILLTVTLSGFSKRFLVGKNRYTTYFAGIISFVLLYFMIAVAVSDGIRFMLLKICRFSVNPDTLGFFLGWAGILFVGISLLYGMLHAGKICVKRYPIRVENGGKPYGVVLLSDLHIGYYVGKQHIEKIVKEVNRLDADLVLISGDLINAGNTKECPELKEVEELLSKISAKEGVYAVTGNHDPKREDPDFKDFLKESGIRLLEDEVLETKELTVIGRNSRTEARRSLSELTDGCVKRPFVVLDHDPLEIEEARKEGVDYLLCGHTHKGQIFPLNLFLRALYQKEEIWGCTRWGKTTLIVSAGSGYFSMPMRIGTDSEVVFLEQK